MRFRALKVICSAYRLYPFEQFQALLGFVKEKDAIKFANRFGIDTDFSDSSLLNVQGKMVFVRGEVPNLDSITTELCSWIEEKKQNHSLAQVILAKLTKFLIFLNFIDIIQRRQDL